MVLGAKPKRSSVLVRVRVMARVRVRVRVRVGVRVRVKPSSCDHLQASIFQI